jgi:FkbM family methyltransferase
MIESKGEKKFYIEAGANDGIQQSRSLHLKDDKNYHGIMIEANPIAFAFCQRNRNPINHTLVHAALVPLDYEFNSIDLYGRSGPQDPTSLHQSLMSCVSDSSWRKRDPKRFTDQPMVTVPAVPIQSILDNLKVDIVEYFFLDVEGYEAQVLQGLSGKIKIKHLEVELHDLENPEEEKNKITQICNKLNMELFETIQNEGHDKLVFKTQQDRRFPRGG